MASNTYKSNTFRKKETAKAAQKKKGGTRFTIGFLKDKKIGLSLGIIFMMVAVFLFFAFLGYLFAGQADQSVVLAENMSERQNAAEARNWLGFTGATVSHYMIFRWFGIAAFLLPPYLFLLGFKLAFKKSLVSLSRYSTFALFFIFWLGLLTGYIVHILDNYTYLGFLSGGFGYELAQFADDFLGWGTFILIFGSLLIFVIFYFNIDHLNLFSFGNDTEAPGTTDDEVDENGLDSDEDDDLEEFDLPDYESKPVQEEVELADSSTWAIKNDTTPGKKGISEPTFSIESTEEEELVEEKPQEDRKFTVQKPVEEKTEDEVLNLDPYDPTLDLPKYQYPTLDLLNEYDLQKVTVSRQELEENKNKIVETLVNFKIGIQEIKATIGPTVTLYEIVPDPGVKISKIKNLEDDIALSLAALGIRIIAPIPGKGTIGIEVPNKNRELVPARSVLGTEKFMKSDKELPIALGKTISNEVFVMDLA